MAAKKKDDLLSLDEVKALSVKDDFSPYTDEKVFKDTAYGYNVLRTTPGIGPEILGAHIKIFEKLAAKGYGPAACQLGYIYHNGEPWQEPDIKKSVEYHKKGAQLGNADSMFELYIYYSTGTGVTKDNSKAIEWCKKAAELEQNRACYNMGSFYASGNGMPKDIKLALDWYDKASKGGNGKASATLGVMYKLGDGVEPDDSKGFDYFVQSLQQGFDVPGFLSSLGIEIPGFSNA